MIESVRLPHPDIAGPFSLGPNPSACMAVYKNGFPVDQTYGERLEACLTDSNDEYFHRGNATVGDIQEMKDYRDCSDFKIGGTQGEEMPYYQNIPDEFSDLKAVYEEVIANIHFCVNDYTKRLNINLEYFESPNFVKYVEGQHFQIHPDDGFSYSCTTSVVAFFNTCGEDYEGGQLDFPYQGFTFTPQAGDIVVFPSNYPYVHQSLPILSGTKYSCVVMYDYNDRNHQRTTLNNQLGGAFDEVGVEGQVTQRAESFPKVG